MRIVWVMAMLATCLGGLTAAPAPLARTPPPHETRTQPWPCGRWVGCLGEHPYVRVELRFFPGGRYTETVHGLLYVGRWGYTTPELVTALSHDVRNTDVLPGPYSTYRLTFRKDGAAKDHTSGWNYNLERAGR